MEFKCIINNLYLRNLMFGYVRSIHDVLCEIGERRLSWRELVKSEYQLAYFGYVNELKLLMANRKDYTIYDDPETLKSFDISNFSHLLSETAAKRGNLQLLEYLCQIGEFFGGNELALAIKNKHFHLIDFFLSNFGKNNQQNMDAAIVACAEGGLLEQLKQIYPYCDDYNDWCSAIDTAFGHYHFELGKWIFKERKVSCSKQTATNMADYFQDKEIILWLLANGFYFQGRIVSIAIKMNDINLVSELMKQYYFEKNSLSAAVEANRMNMVEYLIFTRRKRYTTKILAQIAGKDGMYMMLRIGGSKLQHFGKLALSAAAENGHTHIIDALHEVDRRITCTKSSLKVIAYKGDKLTLKYLYASQPESFTSELLDSAVTGSKSLKVLKFLVLKIGLNPKSSTFESAAVNGNLEAIKFLSNFSTVPSNTVMQSAVRGNHYHVIEWVFSSYKDELQRTNLDIPNNVDTRILQVLLDHNFPLEIERIGESAMICSRYELIDYIAMLGEVELARFKMCIFKIFHLVPFSSLKYFIKKHGDLPQEGFELLEPIRIKIFLKQTYDVEYAHFLIMRVGLSAIFDDLKAILQTKSISFIRYFVEFCRLGSAVNWSDTWADNNSFVILKYGHHKGLISEHSDALDIAATKGNLNTIKFLHTNTPLKLTQTGVVGCTRGYHQLASRYLYYNGKNYQDFIKSGEEPNPEFKLDFWIRSNIGPNFIQNKY